MEEGRLVVHVEDDGRPVGAHSQTLQREHQHGLATEPGPRIRSAEPEWIGDGVRRTKLRDGDRLPVSSTDAQLLTADERVPRILTTLAESVGERPDRGRLAAPPARLRANTLALRRHASGNVSPACPITLAAHRGGQRHMRARATGVADVVGAVVPVARARSSSLRQPAVRRATLGAAVAGGIAALQGIDHAVAALGGREGDVKNTGSGGARAMHLLPVAHAVAGE